MPHRPRRFQRTAQIAEMATTGVAHHLDDDRPELALPLQTVAAAAWGAAVDSTLLPDLHGVVQDALADLDDIAGAGPARNFLLMVNRHLESALAATGDAADPDTAERGAMTLF